MGVYELVKDDECAVADPIQNLCDLEEGFASKKSVESGKNLVGKAAKSSIAGSVAPLKKLVGDVGCPPSSAARNPRLVSLDVFRGITVALMILVDDAGGFCPAINHSPWNGVTIADFVMPFFLFIVGVSLGLTFKNVSNRIATTMKVVLRALKLITIGLLLQGGYFHGIRSLTFGVDLQRIRLMGVLQRIGIAYLLVAVCEVWHRSDALVDSGYSLMKKYRTQLLVGGVLTATYVYLLYGLFVPDWEYQIPLQDGITKFYSVKCGVRGDTSPACNAVGMIDRKILGIEHLYKRPVYGRTQQCSINSPYSGPLPSDAPSWCEAPFDPEGLLSTIMAVVTCLIGLQFGHVIVHFKHHKDRILHWMIPSSCLLASAFCLDFFGMHMNKALYTVSYTCVTAGVSGFLLAGSYLLVDVYGIRRPMLAMEWMGKHALEIFVLMACNILPIFIQGIYWKEPGNNLLRLIGIGS
ncbi:heparan-alpha-glucosaminide N-acetyltransferase isoform X2 [Phalaenopsis equestris]|uniref:heparan-alpha-glucosaminide N-acetyltransferase isoform X2 n=1 Tax=Phalaenopsis equestris TaxID=78828 RepID=UPI0009E4B5E5|nr:heparan-alpha-glucosaminide N-acetyltransferase isoform X2 [Phalaenopsis equestris]